MKKEFRKWAFWRRVQYAVLLLLLVTLSGAGIYRGYFYTPGDCFDGKMNQGESGVDCGGACVRICAAAIAPPVVLWAKSFKVGDGQYNAVAYIENTNQVAATPMLEYTFEFYNGEKKVGERSGKTVLPSKSIYPVFEGRVLLDSEAITETKLSIKPVELWVPGSIGREQFKTSRVDLLSVDTQPRLNVTIENTELTKAENVEVVATLFNSSGEAITASQTFISSLEGRSVKDIVFTWPQPLSKTIRSCEVPSDVVMVLDRSGSMAADGGVPPEPLESAKRAAQSFVDLLGDSDQMGYVSYATNPTQPMEQSLTKEVELVRAAISNTSMGKDGVQYTNMGEAFRVASEELLSSRHRDDARKVMVFMTDGDVTRPLNPQTGVQDRTYAAKYAREQADLAKQQNIIIYSIGFGSFFGTSTIDVARDTSLIKDLASEPSLYYEAPTVTELEEVYKQIAVDLCESGATRIDVIAKTPTNFTPLR